MIVQRSTSSDSKDTGEGNSKGGKGNNQPTADMAGSSKPFEKRIIAVNGTKTAVGLAAAFYVLYFHVPIPAPLLPSATHRLVYTLRFQTPAFLLLGAAILNVSLIRLFTTAIDPLNGKGEHHVLFAGHFLTNTVEQTLLNVPAQLILATFLDEAQMKVIPILAAFFVFGRVSFFVGYRQSYLRRTVGYVATFAVSMVVWIANAWFVGRAMFNNEPIVV